MLRRVQSFTYLVLFVVLTVPVVKGSADEYWGFSEGRPENVQGPLTGHLPLLVETWDELEAVELEQYQEEVTAGIEEMIDESVAAFEAVHPAFLERLESLEAQFQGNAEEADVPGSVYVDIYSEAATRVGEFRQSLLEHRSAEAFRVVMEESWDITRFLERIQGFLASRDNWIAAKEAVEIAYRDQPEERERVLAELWEPAKRLYERERSGFGSSFWGFLERNQLGLDAGYPALFWNEIYDGLSINLRQHLIASEFFLDVGTIRMIPKPTLPNGLYPHSFARFLREAVGPGEPEGGWRGRPHRSGIFVLETDESLLSELWDSWEPVRFDTDDKILMNPWGERKEWFEYDDEDRMITLVRKGNPHLNRKNSEELRDFIANEVLKP